MDKKSILAVVLSLIVLYVYQVFFVKPPVYKNNPASVKQETTAPTEPISKPPEQAVGTATAKGPLASLTSRQQQTSTAVEKDITLETAEYKAIFSTRGATLKSLQLKKYRVTVDKNSPLVELIQVGHTQPSPLSVSFAGSDVTIPEDALYEMKEQMADAAEPTSKGAKQFIFTVEYPSLLKVEKIFTFNKNHYSFDLDIKITNLSASTLGEINSLDWYEIFDPEAPTEQYGHVGPVFQLAGSVEREDPKKLSPLKTVGPGISWAGYESKYFIAAIIPQAPSLTTLSVAKEEPGDITLGIKSPKNMIPPGQSIITSYTCYMGPKDYTLLKPMNVGLENSVDFGSWLKWLAMPLLIVLKFLHDSVVHNYGIAIIILTSLIKLIFWPLGNKSYRSMKEMQKLQPLMTELRDKYKDDKARLSQEMMSLYKSHKVNPMGGCLPMVIQIPVFFGLYKTLLYAIELRHSPFFWWIQDLSAKDPYYITPLIMGGTMFLQQKMTPPAGDPMQAKIMLLMPVIFTVMFLNFPSGLVVYWLFNNLISIGQQYYINKSTS